MKIWMGYCQASIFKIADSFPAKNMISITRV